MNIDVQLTISFYFKLPQLFRLSTIAPVISQLKYGHFMRTQNSIKENITQYEPSNKVCRYTIPTGIILEAPELETPRYKGQNVGSQWCPL